jgi:nucleoid DNA-binding protein/cell division protein FtsN
MLDEYIKELITNNNRVIIPNFGAFLLRATSKNKNKKELSAKISDIYFSPFLKFNDELLVNHVMKKEELDQKGAMDKITEYIKTIENSVKEKGSYNIGGLGTFYMDNQGKIQFKVEPAAEKEKPRESTPQASGSEPEKKETPKTTSTINEKAAERKKATEKPKQEQKEKEEEKVQDKTSKQAPVSSRSNTNQPKTAQAKSNQGKVQQSPKKGASHGKTPPPPSGGKKKTEAGKSGSKGNRGLILSIVIGVPVAVLFIWAMLNFDTVQDLFTKDKHQISVTETADETKGEEGKQEQTDSKARDEDQSEQEQMASKPSEDEVAEKPSESEEAVQQTETNQKQSDVEQTTDSPGSKKYYIVAGSFKKKQNAIDFREELINKGYNSEMIGERNGMHAVSYASFNSKSRAENELQRLRDEEGVKAWILYY